MEAPRFVTDALYRLHPQVRLGWVGQDRAGPADELNKGSFALLQLYHSRDAERTFYGDPWNDRGPIYGRRFDRLQRVPIMLATVPPDHITSGAFLCGCRGCIASPDKCKRVGCGHQHDGYVFRRWMDPIGARMLEAAEARGAAEQAQFDDLAGEAGQYLYWQSQQTDAARPPVVAKKFLTEDDKAVLGGETIQGVKDTYVNDLKATAGAEPLR